MLMDISHLVHSSTKQTTLMGTRKLIITGTSFPARTLLDSKHMEMLTLPLMTPSTGLMNLISRTNISYIPELT